jgi:hypothetical protein
MVTADRPRRCEAARVRGELDVHELWLRYLALGGTSDVFDIDAYLQSLLPLVPSEEIILAVALNERLDEVYRAARIPIPMAGAPSADDVLARLVEDLLREVPVDPDMQAPVSPAGHVRPAR